MKTSNRTSLVLKRSLISTVYFTSIAFFFHFSFLKVYNPFQLGGMVFFTSATVLPSEI